MFYLVYCTCMGIIRNIYHVVATMLCVFTQGRRCIVVNFPLTVVFILLIGDLLWPWWFPRRHELVDPTASLPQLQQGQPPFHSERHRPSSSFQWHCNHQNVWSLWSLSYSTRFQNLNEANVILRWTYPWRPGRRRPTSTRGASPSSPALHSTERTQQIFTSFGTNV